MNEPRCLLKAYKKGGGVVTVWSRYKRRFLSRVQALPAAEFEKYYCRIIYFNDITNDFIAHTKKEVIEKYKIFTAKDEIEFVWRYWGKV